MGATKAGGGQKKATRREEDVEEADQTDAEKAAAVEAKTAEGFRLGKLGDDVDAILDEIDDVLEENAEEFIRGYVQKGGQ